MPPAQLRIIQALADLAIPLLGYIFLDWSFYFILLFFLLDHLVACVFAFIKARKIAGYRGTSTAFPVSKALLTMLLFAAALAALYPAIVLTNPTFSLAHETWEFIIYTEPGLPIPQGILLLPLIVFGSYQQYKLQFLVPGKFTVTSEEEIWKIHFLTAGIVPACSAAFLGASLLVVLPQPVYILTLIFGVAAYRFLYARA